MEYRIIKMRIFQGHYYLELEINGQIACIDVEQNPTLFSEGCIFIEPQEKWRKTLPIINPTRLNKRWVGRFFTKTRNRIT